MIIDDKTKELFDAKVGDEIVTCTQEDYYNTNNPQFEKVVDIVHDNGKLVILT